MRSLTSDQIGVYSVGQPFFTVGIQHVTFLSFFFARRLHMLKEPSTSLIII